MKPIITKAQIRAELEQQMQLYLGTGGQVQDVPRGLSGNPNNYNLFHSHAAEPKQERTFVTEVVQTLESRKLKNLKSTKPKRPRKKLITDDFGEPLRWIWVEE